MNKIYGVPLFLQQAEILRFCFDVCGQALPGGIDSDMIGPMIPCRQEQCPFEEASIETPVGFSDGFDAEVYVRKLKSAGN